MPKAGRKVALAGKPLFRRRACSLSRRFSAWRPLPVPFALGVVLLSLLFPALVSGCGGAAGASPDAGPPRRVSVEDIVVAPGEPIIIGISAPVTGSLEPEGTEEADAAITGVIVWKKANGDLIGGHEIVVRVEDDGCTEQEITVQAAQRLLALPGLAGVIGPDCSAGAAAVLPLYDEAGVVSISGSATDSDLASGQPSGRFFFRTVYTSSFLGMIGGLYVADTLHAGTAYLIDDAEPYGQDLMDAGEREMTAKGVKVTRDSAPLGTSDFSAVVERVMRANPDFVGFAGFNPDASLLYRQLRDAGYEGPFGSADAAASVKTFVEPVGPAAEGVVFVGCPLPLPEGFVATFAEVHGSPHEASAFTAQYADAAGVLLDAIAAVAQERDDGSLTVNRTELRDAVRATHVESGLSGHIKFDGFGDRFSPETDVAARAEDLGVAACQVQDGALAHLFP